MAVHVCVMAGVFMIGVGDIALRISGYHRISTPAAVPILTVAPPLASARADSSAAPSRANQRSKEYIRELALFT